MLYIFGQVTWLAVRISLSVNRLTFTNHRFSKYDKNSIWRKENYVILSLGGSSNLLHTMQFTRLIPSSPEKTTLEKPSLIKVNMVYSNFQVNKFFEASVIICWWRKISTDAAYNASWDNFATAKYLVVVNPRRVFVVCHQPKICDKEK